MIFSSDKSGKIKAWSAKSPYNLIKTIDAHSSGVNSLVVSTDLTNLISVSDD